MQFCQDPGYSGDPFNPSGKIQVLVTDPEGNSFAYGKRIENQIKALVNNAKKSVYMAIYNFDNQPLLDSLILAKKRGLTVKIVGDYHELDTTGYRALFDNGLNIIAGNLSAIQHNKFLIVDEKILVTGTGNISHSDFYHNDNHFLIIEDEAIAGMYKREFFQMHTGFFSKIKSSFKMSSSWPQTGLPVEVFFSPQESQIGIQRIIQKIESATDSIYYMIFAFSHDEIATALLKAARRGVRVYGIHDSSFVKGTSEEAPRLFMAGFSNPGQPLTTGPFVHVDGNTNTFLINGVLHGGKMHCKTMIIDPETDHGSVLTGSFNWSNNAVENNDENLLYIKDPHVVKEIKRQWDQAWKISLPLNYKFPNLSGSVANFQDIYISEINWGGTSDGNSFLDNDDYIEIYNNSPKPVDLTHWTIEWSTSDKNYASYSLPDKNDGTPVSGAVIYPGEYRILYGNKAGPVFTAVNYLQKGIKIPDSKEFSLPDSNISVSLYDKNMNLIDFFKISHLLREGNIDPLIKTVASMNRRLKSGSKPESGWYTSTIECNWQVCQTPFFYASPGYQNEPASPPVFKTAEINNDNSFTMIFSGEVNHCLNTPDYIASNGSGNIPIENIIQGTDNNNLVFKIAGAGNPFQSYRLSSRSFPEFQATALQYIAPDLLVGTNSGLSISGDNGITWQSLFVNGIETQKIRHITYDPATLKLYIASENGLFLSTNKGMTFQKIPISITYLSDIVFDIKVNSNYLVSATADGIYVSNKFVLNFQKISPEKAFSLFLNDSLMLAGGIHAIYRAPAPFSSAPTIIPVNGFIHDIKLIGLVYFAASTSGLYSSADSINFTAAYSTIFSNRVLNFIHYDDINQPVVLNHYQISQIPATGVQTYDVFYYMRPTNLNSIFFDAVLPISPYIAAGDYGFFTGNTLDGLHPLNNYACNFEQTLPSGSLVFNGYNSPEIHKPAQLMLNEISLNNIDKHDWLELYVQNSGTLKNTTIEYYENQDKDILYSFPDMFVSAGDILLVYMESPLIQKNNLSSDVTFSRSKPYKFYSTHLNLNRGDGLFIIKQNGNTLDALYYTNQDGNVLSKFMQGGMQMAYFNPEIHNILPKPLPYPVAGWNDIAIQNSGVKIPDSGFARAIVRTITKPSTWGLQPLPTPGIK